MVAAATRGDPGQDQGDDQGRIEVIAFRPMTIGLGKRFMHNTKPPAR
jgi:hypothetical protein